MIAAINGASIGVGLTLVLPFDQILARGAPSSPRGFVKMGLVPELASSHYVTARCGFGEASWLALSGATVLAEEAQQLGLVDRVTEPDALLDTRDVDGRTSSRATRRRSCARSRRSSPRTAGETDLAAVQRRGRMEALNAAYRTPEHAEAVGPRSWSAVHRSSADRQPHDRGDGALIVDLELRIASRITGASRGRQGDRRHARRRRRPAWAPGLCGRGAPRRGRERTARRRGRPRHAAVDRRARRRARPVTSSGWSTRRCAAFGRGPTSS